MVSLLSRAAASLLARQPKPAQRSTPRRAFASAQHTSRTGFLLPPRAYVSDRVRHAAPRGERMLATPAGWRPVAPASKRASPFSSHRSSASPCASHFSLPISFNRIFELFQSSFKSLTQNRSCSEKCTLQLCFNDQSQILARF